MSLSKECQFYHLTHSGWIEGSFHGDVVGGRTDIEVPSGTVLTIACYDEIQSAFSKPTFYDHVVWESADHDLVKSLQAKYGNRPDWFGYNK